MTLLFKIASSAEWQCAMQDGIYQGSSDDLRDGFIHFSTKAQLAVTYNKYFSDQRDLHLICIDSTIFGPELKWEASRSGDLFPHLYAPLPTTHILWEKPITDGIDLLP